MAARKAGRPKKSPDALRDIPARTMLTETERAEWLETAVIGGYASVSDMVRDAVVQLGRKLRRKK